MNPRAIYHDCTIYNPTNNAEPIQYLTQQPYTILPIFAMRTPEIFSPHSPFLRRYTFLSHLTTKSKISVRWIKKLVAATDGVYASIQFYKLVTASVARRFCESSRHISRPYDLQPHQQRCVNKISRPKTSYHFQTYIRNSYFRNIPPIFLLGGDTPFYLISQRNQRFLLDG